MGIKSIALVTSTLILSTSANAALIERLGGLAYYDTDANLTWLADANYAEGKMTWANANTWAASLNISGVTGWRLPDTVDVGNDGGTYTNYFQGIDEGFNITTHSEMSNMYYNVLGNSALYDINGVENTNCTFPDWCLINKNPFTNLLPDLYWSATLYGQSVEEAWSFNMPGGEQSYAPFGFGGAYAWAVHDGDIGAVPIPSAVWLFGSGLIGLIGLARRKD